VALTWDTDWKDAKKFFEAETGRKKPDKNVNALFSKHASGLDKQIKDIKGLHDEIQVLIEMRGDEKVKAKAGQKFIEYEKKVGVFQKAKDDYIKVLKAAVDKEIKDNAQKTVYSKSCMYLAKELTSIHASMAGRSGWLKSSAQQQSVEMATARNAITSVQGSIAKCIAAAGKVKAKPTKAFFDTTIYDPARDLSQFVGNITRLRAKGHQFPDKLNDQQLKRLYQVIRPYGDDKLAGKLAANATKDEVLDELKKFTNAVKSAEAYFKGL